MEGKATTGDDMNKRAKEEQIKSGRREVEEVRERYSVGSKRACINFNLNCSLSRPAARGVACAGGRCWLWE